MARRKNVKRIDPRYFLHETVNRGEDSDEERQEKALAFQRDMRHAQAKEKLQQTRKEKDKADEGSPLEEKRGYLDPPDPSDPGWPWAPGESVEGDRPHPGEARPVLGTPKRKPGESRGQYEKRLMKGQHRAEYRPADPGELDPYELEESWADDDAGGYDRQWKVEQGYKVKGPHVPAKNSRKEQEERARERRRRRVRGGELEEDCGLEEPGEGGAAIGISAPGTEVHVDDISQLSPEEAFAAGMAAAREAIDQAMGAGAAPAPEGIEE